MLRAVLISCVLLSFCLSSSAQSCAKYNFASNQVFSSCNDLPYLNSFLHWNYDSSSKTVRMAYRHAVVTGSKWVAWAINPRSQGMVGAQALVAFQKSDGTMRAYTAPITGYQTRLQEGDLSFPVSDLSAVYSKNEIIIFATLKLENLTSTVNQVWQDGPLSGDAPAMHPTSGSNVRSAGTLNLLSGESRTTAGASNSQTKKRNIHGVLNAVSWGILLPIGALFARYLRVFPSADPAWFYLHATCQTSAYIVGVAGWATGLQLGSQSPGVQYTSHRTIGIVLFCLGTLQVFALLLRPKKDHKYRFYWNIYHHSVGYAVIVLSIINIFKGFDILNPENKWERAYIGILVVLASFAATLEAYTWYVVVKRKKTAASQKMPNGTNGHGARV
ncbi:cytochrome b561 and DOMON domain-containing At5g47530-like [Olea europaea subsp. europaea]|uniref:Cytochrome b561 and DOMON domain-containing protein n=1 Tax=Olea europaea subsp. europaea TaxID=158383 RepID=A0A8S0TZH8_OLEEU|nr:cytochrome b561 and DOMON domain-containing At5g47530-like [Olea europaea subsp. europaea]